MNKCPLSRGKLTISYFARNVLLITSLSSDFSSHFLAQTSPSIITSYNLYSKVQLNLLTVYFHLTLDQRIDQTPLRRGALNTTLCDQVCQWLAAGQWFSPVSFTNKTDRYDITEILLKVALITITPDLKRTYLWIYNRYSSFCSFCRRSLLYLRIL